MSIAGKLGGVLGRATAYVVHYMEKGVEPMALVSVIYTNRGVIKDVVKNVAAKHVIDSSDPEAVTNNLFECLPYID